eukprot:403331181
MNSIAIAKLGIFMTRHIDQDSLNMDLAQDANIATKQPAQNKILLDNAISVFLKKYIKKIIFGVNMTLFTNQNTKDRTFERTLDYLAFSGLSHFKAIKTIEVQMNMFLHITKRTKTV